MKRSVDRKILLDIINPWSRVDKNIPVSLCEKNSCMYEENWCTRPLNQGLRATYFQLRLIQIKYIDAYTLQLICIHIKWVYQSNHEIIIKFNPE